MVLVKPGIRPITRGYLASVYNGKGRERTCRTEYNPTDNLCDDSGLPDLAKRISEELGHADDDHWERRKK